MASSLDTWAFKTASWQISPTPSHSPYHLSIFLKFIGLLIKDIGQPVHIFVKVFDVEQRKRTVVSQLKLMDGVLLILDMFGDGLQVLMFCKDEAMSRRIGLISSISGDENPLVLRNWQALGFRPCELTLTKTDPMILKSLRKDPRKSTQQVANETKISARTVERRIKLLTENYAFFHMFRLDFPKLDGVICSTVVSYKDEKEKPRLDRMIDSKLDRIIYSATGAKMTSLFNFVCNNVAEAEETHDWVRSLDGVAQRGWESSSSTSS